MMLFVSPILIFSPSMVAKKAPFSQPTEEALKFLLKVLYNSFLPSFSFYQHQESLQNVFTTQSWWTWCTTTRPCTACPRRTTATAPCFLLTRPQQNYTTIKVWYDNYTRNLREIFQNLVLGFFRPSAMSTRTTWSGTSAWSSTSSWSGKTSSKLLQKFFLIYNL